MDVLAEDHDAVIGVHTAVHDAGDGVDESRFGEFANERGLLFYAGAGEFAQVATYADVGEGRVGPEFRTDPARAGFALGVRFGEFGRRFSHCLLCLFADRGDARIVDEFTLDEFVGEAIEWIAVPPGFLLFLRPISKSAAGERAVLVEEAIDLGFDDRRTIARPHVFSGRLHGQVDGKWIHAVDAPGRNPESGTSARQPGLTGCLADCRRDGIQVIFDEEAQREFPCGCEVHGLEHRADVDSSVAEIADRDVVGSGRALCPGIAGAERNAAADDRVRAECTGLVPLQMHRAPAAVAVAGSEAEDF